MSGINAMVLTWVVIALVLVGVFVAPIIGVLLAFVGSVVTH